jgi:hypothetical protein
VPDRAQVQLILLDAECGFGLGVRWPRRIGQVSKLGSPFEKDGPR